MSKKDTLLIICGIGSWVLFIVAVSSGGFGLLENFIGTHTSNWLLLLSILLAIFAAALLLRKLADLSALSLPMVSGILGLMLIGTIVVLALLRVLRFS